MGTYDVRWASACWKFARSKCKDNIEKTLMPAERFTHWPPGVPASFIRKYCANEYENKDEKFDIAWSHRLLGLASSTINYLSLSNSLLFFTDPTKHIGILLTLQ